ncbi:MAG: hypothetical protein RIT28_670, partial [Pseudomonadota bacterium]
IGLAQDALPGEVLDLLERMARP